MNSITTKDGVEIYFKDWGPRSAQPIVFHHGWPLSGDDWDTQLLYFLDKGYRVIAPDRRGAWRQGPRVGRDARLGQRGFRGVIQREPTKNARNFSSRFRPQGDANPHP